MELSIWYDQKDGAVIVNYSCGPGSSGIHSVPIAELLESREETMLVLSYDKDQHDPQPLARYEDEGIESDAAPLAADNMDQPIS